MGDLYAPIGRYITGIDYISAMRGKDLPLTGWFLWEALDFTGSSPGTMADDTWYTMKLNYQYGYLESFRYWTAADLQLADTVRRQVSVWKEGEEQLSGNLPQIGFTLLRALSQLRGLLRRQLIFIAMMGWTPISRLQSFCRKMRYRSRRYMKYEKTKIMTW